MCSFLGGSLAIKDYTQAVINDSLFIVNTLIFLYKNDLKNCFAQERGGVITLAEKSTLIMTNSTIINSYAFYGGVIYTQDFSVIYFIDCEIFGSRTSGTLIDLDHSILSMANNKISKTFNNLFLITSSNVTITGIIITDHECNTIIQGCLLTSLSESQIQISNATFLNIKSLTSDNIYLTSSLVSMNNIFINDTINEKKEGCCIGSTNSELNINGSVFENYLGNCLNIQFSVIRLNNTLFHSNQYDQNWFSLGAFYCLDCFIYIINRSIFSSNKHVVKGAAINCINTYKKNENASLSKIINSIFQENEGNELGGAIYLQNQQVEVESCDFLKNSANEGGGIYCSIDGK